MRDSGSNIHKFDVQWVRIQGKLSHNKLIKTPQSCLFLPIISKSPSKSSFFTLAAVNIKNKKRAMNFSSIAYNKTNLGSSLTLSALFILSLTCSPFKKLKEILKCMGSSIDTSYPTDVLGYPQSLHDLFISSTSLHCLLS